MLQQIHKIVGVIDLRKFLRSKFGAAKWEMLERRSASAGVVARPVQAAVQRAVLDAKDAARQLMVSLSMIYKLLRLRQLEGYAIGRRKFIYADSLDALRRRSAIRLAPMPEPRSFAASAASSGSGRRRHHEPRTPIPLPIRLHLH